MRPLILTLLAVAFFASVSMAAVARVQLRVGDPVKFDFGDGHYVIRRITRGAQGSQYIFAGPHCQSGWVTEDKVRD